MSDAKSVSGQRSRQKSNKVLKDDLDRQENDVQELLSIDISNFPNSESLRKHGVELKKSFNDYRTLSKTYSDRLVAAAALHEAASVISARHFMNLEFKEAFNLIQSMLQQANFDAISEIESVMSSSTINDAGKPTAAGGPENEDENDLKSKQSVSVPRQEDESNLTNHSPVVNNEPEHVSNHHDNEITKQIRTEKYVENQARFLEKPKVGRDFNPNPSVLEFIPEPNPPYQHHTPMLTTPFQHLNAAERNESPPFNSYNESPPFNSYHESHPFNSYNTMNHPGRPPNAYNMNRFPNSRYQQNQSNPNSLQEALAKQILTKDLIKDSIEVFDGTSYKYRAWIQQINDRVKSLSLSPSEYIQVLESNSSGDARRLIQDFVSSCGFIDQEKAEEIFKILTERFGSNSIISKDLLAKLKRHPPVKHPKLEESLVELISLCRLLLFNMRDTTELQFLNIATGAELVREKLPSFIQDRWRLFGQNYEDSHYGMHPPFERLVDFLSKQLREISNSNYKNISNLSKSSLNDTRNVKVYVTKDTTETSGNEFCFLHQASSHNTADCKQFAKLNYHERKKVILEHKLCYLCLQSHMMSECKTKVSCDKCTERHCTVMHREPKQNFMQNKEKKYPYNKSFCTQLCGGNNTKSCSKTLLIDVKSYDVPDKVLRCYAVVDEHSNCTLVDPRVAEYFGVDYPTVEYSLSTSNGSKVETNGKLVTGLKIRGVNQSKIIDLPPAYTNDCIPNSKDEVATPKDIRRLGLKAKYASNFLELDDNAQLMLLIGRNCGDALKTTCYGNKAPFIHRTPLGWAAVGETCESRHPDNNARVYKTKIDHEHYEIKRSFPKSELPEETIKKNVFQEFQDDHIDAPSEEERKFMSILEKTITTEKDGSLTVPLPFRDDFLLPSNQDAVFKRTANTLRRIKLDPNKLKQCLESIDKSLSAGHIEEVPEEQIKMTEGSFWYLPVFAISHPKKSKVRLVYDASAEYHGSSLNKVMLKGPDQNNQLRDVLLRFREGLIGFVADIQNMFNNFKVARERRDYLRFFWFAGNSPDAPLTHYRSTSHIFGCSSSPAIANFCLRYAVKDLPLDSPAEKYIQKAFYVDDGISSANTASEAISTLKVSIDTLAKHNVRLHKIHSNSPDVLAAFSESERAHGCTDFRYEEVPSHRTLGVLWNPDRDIFGIEVNLPIREFTKRGIISITNSIFDPCGFVVPVVLGSRLIQRMIMPPKSKSNQELSSYGWDDPLPPKYKKKWESWQQNLPSLTEIEIPRSFIPNERFLHSKIELHVFSDASEDAIGFVMYLRFENQTGDIHVSFVSSGSKVAPRAATSIPRLELCAAVEATLAANKVIRETDLSVDKTIFHTDSKIILGYIWNTRRQFSQYVTRRIKIILTLSSRNQWCYIKTKENPADLCTRPQTPQELAQSTWFTGPKFLKALTVVETTKQTDFESDDLPEEKPKCTTLLTHEENTSPITLLCQRINSLNKVLGIINRILNVKYSIDIGKQSNGISLAPRKLFTTFCDTKVKLIKVAQLEHFNDSIRYLISHGRLPENNSISNLSPFIDRNGLIRVGGRIRHSSIPSDCKNPVLLPEKHIITSLFLRHFHETACHQGEHITHGFLRSNGYHILNGKKVVKTLVSNCTVCRKLRAEVATQVMSDLPADRLEETPPFSNVGLDLFGPYFIHDGKGTRRNCATKKVWVMICVCLVSRAVHVELVPSLDTSSFRNALSRFIAIRGTVSIIRSDNGTNFVAAWKQMKETSEINIESLQNELKSKDVEWRFNPPGASHCGGAYERKIGSIKRVLDASMLLLQNRSLSRDEFHTLLHEAARVVNNTPLTPVSAHPDDSAPLTPASLLTLKESPALPPLEKFGEEDLLAYGQRRWRRVQYLAEQFWVRWRREYLQLLQTRQKWRTKKRNLAVGDVVLIRNKTEKRHKWPMGRVISVSPSDDNCVRSVELKTVNNPSIRRSIHDLILISTST